MLIRDFRLKDGNARQEAFSIYRGLLLQAKNPGIKKIHEKKRTAQSLAVVARPKLETQEQLLIQNLIDTQRDNRLEEFTESFDLNHYLQRPSKVLKLIKSISEQDNLSIKEKLDLSSYILKNRFPMFSDLQKNLEIMSGKNIEPFESYREEALSIVHQLFDENFVMQDVGALFQYLVEKEDPAKEVVSESGKLKICKSGELRGFLWGFAVDELANNDYNPQIVQGLHHMDNDLEGFFTYLTTNYSLDEEMTKKVLYSVISGSSTEEFEKDLSEINGRINLDEYSKIKNQLLDREITSDTLEISNLLIKYSAKLIDDIISASVNRQSFMKADIDVLKQLTRSYKYPQAA